MADYWKSQPRKFCDFCKCWIADNKPSIEFHEKGKKHQENVRQKLSEIGKKGQKMWKDKQKYESIMEDIEKKAMEAFKKDLQNDSDLACHYNQRLSEMPSTSSNKQKYEDSTKTPLPGPDYGYGKPESKSKMVKHHSEKNKNAGKPLGLLKFKKSHDPKTGKGNSGTRKKLEEQKPKKQWCEAKSDEGHPYYWHIYTGESVWIPPEEGYVSLEEQAKTTVETDGTSTQEEGDADSDDEESKQCDEDSRDEDSRSKCLDSRDSTSDYVPECTYGPSVRPNPYGEWQPVVKPVTGPIELDLPEKRESYRQIVPEEAEEEYTFTEKTLSEGMGFGKNNSETISFKRRNVHGFRRNVRKRGDDD